MQDYAKRNWSNCTPSRVIISITTRRSQTNMSDTTSSYAGTSDHDIVSAINAAVLVLKNPTAKCPPPFSILDQKEALFLLAHFVGAATRRCDLSRCGGIPANPDLNPQKDTATETEGAMRSALNPAVNLHYEWDAIPSDLQLDPEFRADAALVQKAQAVVPTVGEPEASADIWASDTVVASHSAFDGLLRFTAFNPPVSVKCFSHSISKSLWTVSFENYDVYLKAQDGLKRDQIAKAGARLAQLLDAIAP